MVSVRRNVFWCIWILLVSLVNFLIFSKELLGSYFLCLDFRQKAALKFQILRKCKCQWSTCLDKFCLLLDSTRLMNLFMSNFLPVSLEHSCVSVYFIVFPMLILSIPSSHLWTGFFPLLTVSEHVFSFAESFFFPL